MTDTSNALAVLRQTVGSHEKEIVETGAVIDWRRDSGWNTLESMLGIPGTTRAVGIAQALQQHAVLACVDVIQRDLSKVDVELFERMPDGSEQKVAPEKHWLAGMLALDPNEEHLWSEFWSILTIHLVLSNNVYVAKRMARNGDVKELIPVLPGRAQILHNPSTFEKYYLVTRGSLFEQSMLRGLGDYFTPDQMIHVRKRVVDGLHGLPTLYAGAQAITMADSINDYQQRLYDNDGQARIAVQQNAEMRELSPEAFARLKQEIRAAAKKMMSGGEAMLLEPGYTAKVLAMSAADLKLAEMHDAAINAVARVFGVPPHKIGHISDEKYSNMEVLERTYAHDVLIPIARIFEQTFGRSLLTAKERLKYFMRFNRKQMEIIDFKTRSEMMKIGMQHAAVMPDEFRSEFGMNPLPNGAGRVRFVQSTMSMLEGDSNEVLVPAGAQPQETDDDKDAPEDDKAKGLRLVS